jgi:hypothetical protein
MSQDSVKQEMDAKDNWDVVMLKPEHFQSGAAAHYALVEERKLDN